MLHRYPRRVAVIMLVLLAIVAIYPLWGPALFGS
jgi:branched-chain amino acid transport system permease protein